MGELEPSEGETLRTIKLRVRRAATRLALELEIWDADDEVYFKTVTRRGRRQPRRDYEFNARQQEERDRSPNTRAGAKAGSLTRRRE